MYLRYTYSALFGAAMTILVLSWCLSFPTRVSGFPQPSSPKNGNHHSQRNNSVNKRLYMSTSSDSGTSPITIESLARQLAASSTNNNNNDDDDDEAHNNHKNKKFKNIVVVLGAGISVSAGIPDFRTPGTGLYSKLDEYQLPYPEAIFELDYFRNDPSPFVTIAKAIWPGQKDGPKPTIAHSFVALLEQRGLLKRVYTQNIDGLERLAGVSDERLVECHGHFSTASCTSPTCHRKRDIDPRQCQDSYLNGDVMHCPDCGSLVKPDIVFFGEELPPVFMDHITQDMEECDLLIVMGTSLLVAPVATIPQWVDRKVPRVLINRELVGSFAEEAMLAKRSNGSFQTRDVFVKGDCDDGAQKLCELAGDDWLAQLKELHDAAHK